MMRRSLDGSAQVLQRSELGLFLAKPLRLQAQQHAPSLLLQRLKAAGETQETRILVISGMYGVIEGQLAFAAKGGLRHWASAIGGALRSAGGAWCIVMDGPATASLAANPKAREIVATGMRRAYGGASQGIFGLARAPGDTEALWPRLERAAFGSIASGGRPHLSEDAPSALSETAAVLSRRACRVTGRVPVASAAEHGAPSLLPRSGLLAQTPGVALFGPARASL